MSNKKAQAINPEVLAQNDRNAQFEALATIAGVKRDIDIPAEYEINVRDMSGKLKVVKLEKKELIAPFMVLDKAFEQERKSDLGICVLFAELDRVKAYVSLGFKYLHELGTAVYGLEKATVNTYANIGRTFFKRDENGKYVARYGNCDTLTKGQLIPLLALVRNRPEVNGVEFSDTLISKLFLAGYFSKENTVAELKSNASLIQLKYMPEEWIDEVLEKTVAEDGEESVIVHYVIKQRNGVDFSDFEYDGDPRAPKAEENDNASGDDKGASGDDKKNDVLPIDAIHSAVNVALGVTDNPEIVNHIRELEDALIQALKALDK